MKDCKESVLSGFAPSKEVQDKWAQMLENNGIVKGVECRLIGGQDEGKITTFGGVENCLINDLGISIGNGYFLREEKGKMKVSKPFYEMVEVYEKGMYGGLINGNKKLISVTEHFNEHSVLLNMKTGMIDAVDVKGRIDKGVLYKFKNRKDLFEWLSI